MATMPAPNDGPRPEHRVFSHSKLDAPLAILGALEPVALLACSAGFSAAQRLWAPSTFWSLYMSAAAILTLWNCTNYQCVAHNFIHNPFFKSRHANDAFSVLNTLGLGVPQTLYKAHHFNHHHYGNDKKDPATGTTKDRSSIYAHSKDNGPEPLWRYAFIGPLRVEFGPVIGDARNLGLTRLLAVETVAFLAFVALLVLLDARGFACFYVPVWYLGQVAAYAQNYVEHHHAAPGNKKTDSVSSYGAWYNLLWFNNGYHQEHHFRPQVHWSKIREVRAEMLPESERRVVPIAHFVNL